MITQKMVPVPIPFANAIAEIRFSLRHLIVVPNRNAFKIERFRNMMDARKRVASRGLHVSNHTFFASDQRMGQWARLRLHGNLENTPEVEASFPSGT